LTAVERGCITTTSLSSVSETDETDATIMSERGLGEAVRPFLFGAGDSGLERMFTLHFIGSSLFLFFRGVVAISFSSNWAAICARS